MDNKVTRILHDEKTPFDIPEQKLVVDERTPTQILLKDHDIKVGDMFHSIDYMDILRIESISDDPEDRECISMEHYYEDDKHWSHYGSFTIARLVDEIESRYARIDSIEQVTELAIDIGKNINNLEETYGIGTGPQATTSELMILDKESLATTEAMYKRKANEMLLLEGIMKRKMNELAAIKDSFTALVYRIRKVIGNIELYLGIHEDIIQLRRGPYAPITEPLSLRQRILYMDEEVGISGYKYDLDWKNVDDFDDWLMMDKNLELMLPETKGIVIIRVRRKDKFYTDSPIDNQILNESNHTTYFLMRNGSNVYRIYANLIIEPRLFPGRDEFELMRTDKHQFMRDEAIKDRADMYREHMLVIQGILDRAEIFHFPERVDMFKPDGIDEQIRLIYDDERLLSDGSETYREWRARLNSHNKIGSRVVYSGVSWGDSEDRLTSKHIRNPDPGVYNLARKGNESKYYHSYDFAFLYNPEDTVYRNWYQEHGVRKRAVAFKVDTNDHCILNYDNIDINDIDYFVGNRNEREHYLDMIPMLKKIKEEKIKELTEEAAFVDLVVKELRDEDLRDMILSAIEWWKYKVIQRRPLTREDAKALRMIKGRVKRELKIEKDLFR